MPVPYSIAIDVDQGQMSELPKGLDILRYKLISRAIRELAKNQVDKIYVLDEDGMIFEDNLC